jgi:hypothetical protein|uniref:Uncharacterized protein n=1 Tax=Faecalibaculum rodentium TaxID=1702221 RepID=A0A140DUQ2_9FIRM|nr:hypothetical protein AALO17_12450 [Faecalibaculum rodentium]
MTAGLSQESIQENTGKQVWISEVHACFHYDVCVEFPGQFQLSHFCRKRLEAEKNCLQQESADSQKLNFCYFFSL